MTWKLKVKCIDPTFDMEKCVRIDSDPYEKTSSEAKLRGDAAVRIFRPDIGSLCFEVYFKDVANSSSRYDCRHYWGVNTTIMLTQGPSYKSDSPLYVYRDGVSYDGGGVVTLLFSFPTMKDPKIKCFACDIRSNGGRSRNPRQRFLFKSSIDSSLAMLIWRVVDGKGFGAQNRGLTEILLGFVRTFKFIKREIDN